MIKLANNLDAATKRCEDFGLTDDDIAFYDALVVFRISNAPLIHPSAEAGTHARPSISQLLIDTRFPPGRAQE